MSNPVYNFSLTGPVNDDIIEILDWSETEFGIEAADRYEMLIQQALADIAEDPFRAGAKRREDLHKNVFAYHFASSLNRIKDIKVKKPRHFVVYRVADANIEVLRILHDSRDLIRHLPVEQQ